MNNKVWIAILVLLAACSCGSEAVSDVVVFKYNQTDHITSLDPAFAKSQNNIWAVHHIYEGLLQLDDSLQVVPDLATDYTVSDDGLLYTFGIEQGVYFHKDACFGTTDSTRLLTATDVVYSFRRLLDPSVNSPGSWLFTDKVAGPEAFQAVGDSVFTMQLTKPFLPMLGILTMQYCSVVPREAVEHYGSSWGQHPVGTGPFRFKRWVENQALYLVKNTAYRGGGKSKIDGIKTSFIPDRKIAFLELLNGNLDFVSGLESSFAPNLLTREGTLKSGQQTALQFKKAPYLNMEYLGINLEATEADSPLRKRAFRQALNYALDRKLMLSALRNGVGQPADAGFVPRGLPAHDPSRVLGYYHDKEKARALIEEAGYATPGEIPAIELYTNKDYLDLTTFIAKQWEDVGIRTEIEVLESGILRQGMRKSEIPFFRASWIADYPDAESFLCMFYSKYPPPPNYTRYNNSAYDQLYEKAIATPELEERIALYQQMDRMLVEDAPVVFLFYDETALFYTHEVSGISSNAINLLKVDSLSKKAVSQ